MKLPRKHRNKFRPMTALLCACLIHAQLFRGGYTVLLAQEAPKDAEKKDPVDNTKSTPESSDAPAEGKPPGDKSNDKKKDAKADKKKNDEIEVSFQGANIDMIVQWLAQQTGKSVVKHPQVQCQLTIVSSKKVTPREAVDLVYRALALEGFTAIESSKSILIVPEGKEPKISPAFVESSRTDIPAGRERLVKIFSLKFAQAADMKLKIAALLSEKGTADLDERANQLIVTDNTENVSLVADLIKALDTDKPGDMAVRVIALKNVSAQDLVKDVGSLYQKMGGKSASQKEVVELSANDRSNSLIVMSSEANFKAVQRVVAELDTEDAQEKIMQAFALKNADATDVAKQLKDLNPDQESGNSRYSYFFGGGGNSSKAGKKLTVVADRRRNSVIVQAPPTAMEGIAKMIQALDEPVTDDALAPVIYPLKYVSAVDIEDVLNDLFLKKTQQQRPYWYYDDYPDAGQTADRDVGRLYGKVRITSEPYSNAIILTSNSKENLEAVISVLKQLDVPSEAGESTFRVGLRFAKAADVAKSMNILFAKNGSPPLRGGNQQSQQQQAQASNAQNQQGQQATPAQPDFELEQETKEEGYYPWLGGQPDNTRPGSDGKAAARPVSDLVGRVRVVSDQRSNALLISANVHFFAQVMKLIEDLDVPTPEVMIEARIVEVSSDFLDKLGVRWSPDGSKVFTADDYQNSFLAHGAASYLQGFGGLTTVNGGTNGLTSALTSMRSGVLSGTMNMDLLIQFLKQNTDATVLDQPQMNIADNETGRLFVGQRVPFIQNSSAPAVGGLSQSFTYTDVGVKLEVTPHINLAGDVSLKIHVESSSVVPGQTILGGAVLDSRNFKTDLTSKNGQTLVLGGIIQKQVSDTLRKTPILGDIPGLKWLFNKKDKTSHEVELMVFLRPRVVRTPEEAKELLEETDKKAPLVKKWQEGPPPKDDTGKKKKAGN